MNKQSLIIGIAVIIVAVIGLVVFQPSSQEVDRQPEAEKSTSSAGSDIVRTVDGLHQYQPEEGRHIVAGTTTVPTPCHQLSTETEIRESNPEQLVLSFSAENENEQDTCAQVIQNRRFKVSVQAGENARITGGTFGGDQVKLNLRDVGSGENLDDFQVHTKG
ncbi:MAG: hypothetical protein BRC25_01745 [Parcubacteria group bacterium SW_6_46_9]|nr:MAG: hypothetical protein BRC25_01745 [Parcubacteria group bacterium SW_6_46_9]